MNALSHTLSLSGTIEWMCPPKNRDNRVHASLQCTVGKRFERNQKGHKHIHTERERERCTPSRAQIVFTNKNKHEHKPKHAGSSDWGLVALSHIFAYFCTLTFFCSYCLSFVIFPHFCDSQPPTNLQCFHVSYFSASLRQLIQLIFIFKFAMFFLEFFAFLKLHFYPHLLS